MKTTVFNSKGHSCHPPVFRIRIIKNGAPITAVSTEMGISAAVALRATVSTIIIKVIPMLIQAGSSDT